jgi:hypothetical protein
MAKMTICFTIDPEEDKRVVRWLDELPKRERSRAIRQALASYLGQSGITLADIYSELQEIKRHGVAVVPQDTQQTNDDDPVMTEALANLAKLGL